MEFSLVDGSNIQASTEAAEGDTNDLTDVNRYDPRNPRTPATKGLTKERIQAVKSEGLSMAAAAARLGVGISTLRRYNKKLDVGPWIRSKRKSPERSPGSSSNSKIPRRGRSSENSLLSASHGEIAAFPQQPLHSPSSTDGDGLICVLLKNSFLCELVKNGHVTQPRPMNYVEAPVQIQTTLPAPALNLQQVEAQYPLATDCYTQVQPPATLLSAPPAMNNAQVQALPAVDEQQLVATDDYAQVQAPLPTLYGSFAPAEAAVSYSPDINWILDQNQFDPDQFFAEIQEHQYSI